MLNPLSVSIIQQISSSMHTRIVICPYNMHFSKLWRMGARAISASLPLHIRYRFRFRLTKGDRAINTGVKAFDFKAQR